MGRGIPEVELVTELADEIYLRSLKNRRQSIDDI